MCGAADKLIPPELSREVTSGIQRSKLVIVKEAAHLLPLERPETVAEFYAKLADGNLAMTEKRNSTLSVRFRYPDMQFHS